jgi:hypothetical protein
MYNRYRRNGNGHDSPKFSYDGTWQRYLSPGAAARMDSESITTRDMMTQIMMLRKMVNDMKTKIEDPGKVYSPRSSTAPASSLSVDSTIICGIGFAVAAIILVLGYNFLMNELKPKVPVYGSPVPMDSLSINGRLFVPLPEN